MRVFTHSFWFWVEANVDDVCWCICFSRLNSLNGVLVVACGSDLFISFALKVLTTKWDPWVVDDDDEKIIKRFSYTSLICVLLSFNILVEEQAAQVQQQLVLVANAVDLQTCILHAIPSAHQAVFSWSARTSASAKRSDAATSASYD